MSIFENAIESLKAYRRAGEVSVDLASGLADQLEAVLRRIAQRDNHLAELLYAYDAFCDDAVAGVTLTAALFKAAFGAAVGFTDKRYAVLSGVLLDFREDALALVAADGYRLCEIAIPAHPPEELAGRQCIVWAGALRQALKAIGKDTRAITIRPDEERAVFTLSDGLEITVNTMRCGFPDYEKFMPSTTHKTRAIFDTPTLLRIVKQAAQVGEHGRFDLAPARSILKVATLSQDFDATRTLNGDCTGDPLVVDLRLTYVREVLASLADLNAAQAVFEMVDAEKAVLIQPDGPAPLGVQARFAVMPLDMRR